MKQRPASPRVDGHIHFWDLGLDCYQWITPQHGVLHRNYLPQDLDSSLAETGIQSAILMQAANSIQDTDFLLRCADQTDWVGAVIGWVPLERTSEASKTLNRFASHSKFRGVRHLLGALEEDPDWLIRPRVIEGLRLLAERELVFEVQAEYPSHLKHVPVLAEAVPKLTILIGHLAKPPIRNPEEFDLWAHQLDSAAQYPNVHAKISGMNTVTGLKSSWAQPLTANLVRPYVDHALKSFGAQRSIVGSNWPVCLTTGDSYSKVWSEMFKLFKDRPSDELDALFGGTAARILRLT